MTKLNYPFFSLCHSGRIFCFFIVFVALASSADSLFSQTNWTKYNDNPVLEPGSPGSWENEGILGSTVVFDGNLYHMLYAGFDGTNFRIGHATSEDGISWTKDPLNPVLDLGLTGSWESDAVYMACVVFVLNKFHMWYSGNNGEIERIGHATSMDGSNWTKDSSNPVMETGPSGSWDDKEVFPGAGSVIFDGTNYHMWYGGCNSAGIRQTGHATSSDGTVWIKDTLNNPVMTSGPPGEWDQHSVIPGTVFFDGALYQAWYSGCSGNIRWRIGYATSPDGLTWTRDSANPVLDYGPTGDWDNQNAWNGSVLFINEDQMFKMWYTGGDYFNGSIGHAMEVIDGINDKTGNGQFQTFASFQNYPNPFSTTTMIGFELEQSGSFEIAIVNQFGQVVDKISQNGQKGKNQFNWNAGSLPAGIYFCRITAGNSSAVRKLVLLN